MCSSARPGLTPSIDTGERYDDVIVFWVEDEHEKQALVGDPSTPFFTTDHFNGHPSVLLRACRLGELSVSAVEDAGRRGLAGAGVQASRRVAGRVPARRPELIVPARPACQPRSGGTDR
ncbi:MAG: hypothetical protein R2704_06105 [Microthrixaceae bacterium]